MKTVAKIETPVVMKTPPKVETTAVMETPSKMETLSAMETLAEMELRKHNYEVRYPSWQYADGEEDAGPCFGTIYPTIKRSKPHK